MNVDFHVHGLLSKTSALDETLLLQGIAYAKESGLSALVLCEHFNADHIEEIDSYLESHYPYVEDAYVIEGFTVFLGMEVDILGGGHIIVAGHKSAIRQIRHELQPYCIKPYFIPFEKLLELGEQHQCLMIGSHPYREKQKLTTQPDLLLERLHALDLNAKDIYGKGLKVAEEEVKQLACQLNIPYVTGSDSHYPIQLGSVMTHFEQSTQSIQELITLIQRNEHTRIVSEALPMKAFAAKVTKKHLKELNQTKDTR